MAFPAIVGLPRGEVHHVRISRLTQRMYSFDEGYRLTEQKLINGVSKDHIGNVAHVRHMGIKFRTRWWGDFRSLHESQTF